MARPRKQGLDYFPFDVDIFEDDKLFDVQNEYGPLGEVIYFRLLCLVYKHGYYYRFDSLDKLAAMIIKSVGSRWARDKKNIKEVILYLAECNLLSAELMQRNVITSRSIQRRYLAATERRCSKIEEYDLLEEKNFQEGFKNAPESEINVSKAPVFVTETQVNVCNNTAKESKVNKNKENKSKSEESKENALPSAKLLPPQKYGRFNNVLLTSEEYTSLQNKYPFDYEKKIDRLSVYLESSGKRYCNHYATLIDWIERDGVTLGGNSSDSSIDYDKINEISIPQV